MVGAVLTQNTAWSNVERAIANLKAAGLLELSALLQTPEPALAQQIRPAGYFNVKARRLLGLCRFLAEHQELAGLADVCQPHYLIEVTDEVYEHLVFDDAEHVPIASLTDTAAAKLVWISKGSHKSRRDLRQLVRTSTAEQQREIERFAAGLGLSELLGDVLAESDEIEP